VKRREFVGLSLGAAFQLSKPNAQIQQAREAALAVLKPSRQQLEHGLELHADALVIDSYGFSPRAAPDPDAFARAIASGASSSELDDLLEEMRVIGCVTKAAERNEYMDAWNAAGVTCIQESAGEEGQDPMRLIKRMARFTYVTDRLRDFVDKAVTPDDIVAAKKRNRRCLYFTGNGVPLAQRWTSVEDELSYIRVLFQLGMRMLHITYNRRNMLGDGCAEPANGGLSDLGRAAIAEMNRVGAIVDVAHSGWRTSLEAAKASQRPMVASHSAVAAVHNHIRGKPDEVIRAITDTGGYIGICCIPQFLGRGRDLNAMLDHIDHIVKRFGADYVAIGTDISHNSGIAEAASRKMPKRPLARTRFEYFWPPGSLEGTGHASLSWTNWPMFTVGLVTRGHGDEAIRKILGGNVLRVARAALDGIL
jgi:membrane dipeptidase